MHYNKAKQYLIVLLKVTIIFAAFWVVYHHISTEPEGFTYLLNALNQAHMGWLLLSIALLSVINWGLEIIKWQQLATLLAPISFVQAYVQTIGAQTLAVLTPGRLGEYGAKSLYYAKEKRATVFELTFYHNMHQLLITCIAGLLGMLYLQMYQLVSMVIVGTILVLLAFKFLKNITIKNYSLAVLWQDYKQLPLANRRLNLFVSLARYLVFSHQFYVFLLAFGVAVPYGICMSVIAVMYITASLLPVMALFDVVLKAGAAVFLFSVYHIPASLVLGVTLLMWIFNTGFPALLGTFVIGKSLLGKPTKYL
ncbi:hypothetical protein [Neptunitalea chrysea]|nr:hypothetical protein [Neptunitalea chrysea]